MASARWEGIPAPLRKSVALILKSSSRFQVHFADILIKISIFLAHLIKPVPAPGPEIIAPIVQPAPQPVQPAVVAPAPVPAPAPSGCVDNVKVTCSKYKKYCNVKEYNFLLTKHCPLTCNLCPGGAASSSAENQEPAPLTATGGTESFY